MSLFVKICGIGDLESGRACVEAGADAVGFVFAESPRAIGPSRAQSIADALPSRLIKIAVFRRLTPRNLARVLAEFSPDLVQGDHDTLEQVSEDQRLPVYRDGVDVAPPGGRFLYEGPVSGAGEQVDWARAREVALIGEMILAGGLRPDNVGRAIDTIRPYGVDVSSGVETEPGVKSPELIRSFVAAARAAQEGLVST